MELISKIRRFIKPTYWLTPLNLLAERERFFREQSLSPQFIYPELPIAEIKTYQNKLDLIPNTPKSKELSLILHLLLARGTSAITEISHTLYGCSYPQKLIDQAHLDAKLPGDFVAHEQLSAQEVVTKIKAYLASLGLFDWQVSVSNLRDFYVRIKGSPKTILVSQGINWDFCDFDSLLAHEIDGHVLRSVNASRQENSLYQKQLPFYAKTEEGLASFLGDYLSPHTGDLSRKHHALKYLAGALAQTASFREVFTFFTDYGFTPFLAFHRTFRLKRGFEDTSLPGCFGREAMYYQGMMEVKDFLDRGGDMAKLFAGKVGLADLDQVPIPANELIPKRILNYQPQI